MSQRGGATGFEVDWGEYLDWGYGAILIGTGLELPPEYANELPPTMPRKALGVADLFLQLRECYHRLRPLPP